MAKAQNKNRFKILRIHSFTKQFFNVNKKRKPHPEPTVKGTKAKHIKSVARRCTHCEHFTHEREKFRKKNKRVGTKY